MGHTIAIVTPFLDKQHGTERCVAEQVERLARMYGYEVHVYSGRVEDVVVDEGPGTEDRGSKTKDGRWETGDRRQRTGDKGPETESPGSPSPVSGRIVWHRVPDIPGPYLMRYLWWFVANTAWRWWDANVRKRRYDLTYSPGINCPDADVISVHIVFREFVCRVQHRLKFATHPPGFWPRLLHRRLYYRLITGLERFVYSKNGVYLIPVSEKVARDVRRHYGATAPMTVVYHGVDLRRFHPSVRQRLRPEARRAFHVEDEAFVVLLIGNDWRKKGLDCLLEACQRLAPRGLHLWVVGKDDPAPYRPVICHYGLQDLVRFLPPRPDVEFYYAAADCYVAPSLEDAFALPVLEAMACGLPVIVSRQAGASEIVTDGVDGLILEDPEDAETLARLIQKLRDDPDLRQKIGEHALRKARQYTWDENAAQLHRIFQEIIHQRAVRS